MNGFQHRITGGDLSALAFQLGLILTHSLAFTYVTALLAKRWTFIRSHRWVLVDALAASICALAYFRMCVFLDLSVWLAVLLTAVWSGIVNPLLFKIDGGRALIDTDLPRKVLFRTDYRLARLGAQFGLFTLLALWSNVSRKLV